MQCMALDLVNDQHMIRATRWCENDEHSSFHSQIHASEYSLNDVLVPDGKRVHFNDLLGVTVSILIIYPITCYHGIWKSVPQRGCILISLSRFNLFPPPPPQSQPPPRLISLATVFLCMCTTDLNRQVLHALTNNNIPA